MPAAAVLLRQHEVDCPGKDLAARAVVRLVPAFGDLLAAAVAAGQDRAAAEPVVLLRAVGKLCIGGESGAPGAYDAHAMVDVFLDGLRPDRP